MSTLPPHLEALLADLEPAARRRVGQIRRRRRTRMVALAVAVLMLTTGAALAAGGVDLFGWLHGGSGSQARFIVDRNRIYRGPAPAHIEYRGRVYRLLFRVAKPFPFLSRRDLLDRLAAGERSGSIDHRTAERVRTQIAAVSDQFFERFNLIPAIEQVAVSSPPAPAGHERVPPAGVAMLIVCQYGSCRPLGAAHGIPVAAPVYLLPPAPDWVLRRVPVDAPVPWSALIEQAFGRPLTPAEWALIATLSTAVGSSSSGAPGVHPSSTPATGSTGG